MMTSPNRFQGYFRSLVKKLENFPPKPARIVDTNCPSSTFWVSKGYVSPEYAAVKAYPCFFCCLTTSEHFERVYNEVECYEDVYRDSPQRCCSLPRSTQDAEVVAVVRAEAVALQKQQPSVVVTQAAVAESAMVTRGAVLQP